MQDAFDTAPLDLLHWAATIAMVSIVLWAEELAKWVRRRLVRPAAPAEAAATG